MLQNEHSDIHIKFNGNVTDKRRTFTVEKVTFPLEMYKSGIWNVFLGTLYCIMNLLDQAHLTKEQIKMETY